MIVLDASLMAAWLLGERRRSILHEIFAELRNVPIAVPSHWPLEISNLLRTHMRSGELSIEDFHEVMAEFDVIDMHLEPAISLDEIGPVAQFALTYDLTTYDAAYVQLALQRNAILATLDLAMRRAATALNIPLLPAVAP